LVLTIWPWFSAKAVWLNIIQLEGSWVLAAAISYFIAYIGRSERFIALGSPTFGKRLTVLEIVCLHGFFNHVLPMRLGELSFMHYSSKYRQMNWTLSSSHLLMARFLDIGTLFSIILICGLMTSELVMTKWKMVAVISLVGVWVAAGLFGRRLSGCYALWLFRHGRGSYGLKKKCFLFLGRILCELRRLRKEALLRSFAWSMVIWLCLMLSLYFGLISTGIFLAPTEAFLGSSVAIIATILPLGGLGTLGTYEAGWTLGYSALGMPTKQAVSCGIVVHFLIILFATVLAVFGRLGLLWETYSERKGSH